MYYIYNASNKFKLEDKSEVRVKAKLSIWRADNDGQRVELFAGLSYLAF